MFVQKLEKVTAQLKKEYLDKSNKIFFLLYHAITIWCEKFNISQNITDYILTKHQLTEIKNLTSYIYQEWEPKQREENYFLGKRTYSETSKLNNIVTAILTRINVRSEGVKIIVLIAFVITAVGYWLYILDRQKPIPPVYNPPVQKITKQFVFLVISALQTYFLKLLEQKGRIDISDGEEVYGITKYLWLGSETESQKLANDNHYLVSKGEESEYDIYLVNIELKQTDKGFKPNVNQLDRYDAFRKLADLGVSLNVSPRLRMEAYGNMGFYSR